MSWFGFGEEVEEDPNAKKIIVERMYNINNETIQLTRY